MGSVPGDVQSKAWGEAGKCKGRRKKENGANPGCWNFKMKVRSFCILSRSKVNASLSGGTNTYRAGSKSAYEVSRDRLAVPIVSPTTANNPECHIPTPAVGEDLKVASQLKKWIEENGIASVRPGTGVTVAVKVLNHAGLQGHKEWLAEVKFLGDLVHPNLVKLIGYCIEDDQRLLVYEFMARGSLENHLFRRALPLPWNTRVKIALGAAKGLAFLHEETERPVIYRDFKTSNVLLDAEYNAKLSDFGLAKDGPEGDKTHVSTRVMGTYGYAAPEYVMTGHLTSKNDVYSFGVVLLEMLTGRRSMDKKRPTGEHNLVEWAWPHLREKRGFHRLIDSRLESRFSIEGAQKVAELAVSCLSRDPKARPLMSDVVSALEPLVNLKDMPSSSMNFKAERLNARNSKSQGHASGNGLLKITSH